MIKTYKIFVNIIFVIVIAFLVTYLVFRVTDKVEIYRVKTGSMEEKIHVGDYIMIYRKKNYNVGEIVTYTSNDGFITHRIIKKDGGKIITKGDANNTEDKEIAASTIVGEAILIGGILNIIINYKYVIVCILISLYLFSCYFGNGKNKEKEKDTSEEENKEDILIEEKTKEESFAEEKEETKLKESNEEQLEIKEDNEEKKETKLNNSKEEQPEIKEEDKNEVKDTSSEEKKEDTLIKKKTQ